MATKQEQTTCTTVRLVWTRYVMYSEVPFSSAVCDHSVTEVALVGSFVTLTEVFREISTVPVLLLLPLEILFIFSL